MTSRSLRTIVVNARMLDLSVIFLLAVSLRLLFLWSVRGLPTYRFPQIDEMAAHNAALACLNGQVPSQSYLKAPVYMYFLAGIYRIMGPDPYYARVVQAVLCSLSAVLVYLIADRLFGRIAGLIAGLVGSAYWVFIFYAVELVDASLAGLLYILLLYLLVSIDERKWWHWLACGAVMGLGAITRPNVLVFAPVLAIAVLIVTLKRARRGHASGAEPLSPIPEVMGCPPCDGAQKASIGSIALETRRPETSTGSSACRTSIFNVAALTVGCCMIIAPVTARNRIVGGEWVPIAAYGGINFWVANNPESDGKNVMFLVGEGVPQVSPIDPNDVWSDADLNNRIARHHAETRVGRPLRRGEVDNYCFRMGFDYIREYPYKFCADLLRRFTYLLNSYEFASVRDPYLIRRFSPLLSVLSYFHFGLLCPLIVIGLAMAATTCDKPTGFTYYMAMLVSMVAGGVLFVVNSRFRVPLVCLAVPMAGYGMVRLVGLARRDVGWFRRIAWGCALAGAAILSNWDFLNYRPVYHTDLRFGEATACLQNGQRDLLAEATARFEEATDLDEKSGRRTWSTLITHSRPNSLLFMCFHALGDTRKSILYGTRALLREPYDDKIVKGLFADFQREEGMDVEEIYGMIQAIAPLLQRHNPDILKEVRSTAALKAKMYFTEAMREAIRTNRAVLAYNALQKMTPVLLRHDRNLLGEFYLQVGGGAKDQRLLAIAVRLFEDLARENPLETKYEENLARARKRLAEALDPARSTGSRPTTTAQPGRG